jgi:DNA-binding CsgD family transcriptional regulator
MKNEKESFSYSNEYQSQNRDFTENPVLFTDSKIPRHNKPENDPFLFFNSCLIDYSGRQFACIHEHCMHNNHCFKNELLQDGSTYHALRFHPEDINIWCEEVFPDILRFLNSIPESELPEYRFSFNQRYILIDGSISQFLHEGSLSISEETKLPTLNLKVFTEIGDLKSDNTILLTIFRYSAEHGYQKVFSKMYGNNCNALLSLREMEIIKLCLDGLSSKMIADKLNLSIHTVKNHKRNCMEKTLTHNIAELIHLCVRSHWL